MADTRGMSRRGFLTGTALTLAAGLAACAGTIGSPEPPDSVSPSKAEDQEPDTALDGTDAGAGVGATSMVGSPWVSANLAGNLEADYEPGPEEDFYVSACGAWLRSQELGQDRHDVVPLVDNAREAIRSRIITSLEGNPLDDPTLHSLQNAFELMRGDLARNERGLEDLETELDRIGRIDSIGAMSAYLTEREPTFWGAPFVSFDVVPDEGEGTSHVVVATVKALSTYANRNEYAHHSVEGATELERVRSVFYLVLDDTSMGERAEEAFDASYAWQSGAATHTRDSAKAESGPIRLSRKDLVSLAGPFPLDDLLSAWGLEAADDFEISSADANALDFLGKTYTAEHLAELTGVIYTSLVHEVALGPLDYLTTDIRDGVRTIFGTYVDDSGGQPPTSDPVVDAGAVHELARLLPTAVERLFCNAYATDARQKVVTGLAADIASAYGDLVGGATWLSPKTAETARAKLAALRVVALRPASWEDEGLAIGAYSEGETLWSARLELERARRHRLATLSGLGRGEDEFPRGRSLLDLDCTYDAARNTLFVPAGMVATGLIEPDLTTERRLAGAAMALARATSRVFTDEGVLFDDEGRRRTWWDANDWAAYNERAERVVSWFCDLYRPLDRPVEDLGRRVLKETLAEFCAMRVTLLLAEASSPDLTDLFDSYAQCHLRLMDRDALESLLATSEFAPEATAVNLTLAQFDEFRSTFGVTEGDAMYVSADDCLLIW